MRVSRAISLFSWFFLQNRRGVRPCTRPLTPLLFSLRANLATASLDEVGQDLAYRISPGSRK
jgi:hypothetical protein